MTVRFPRYSSTAFHVDRTIARDDRHSLVGVARCCGVTAMMRPSSSSPRRFSTTRETLSRQMFGLTTLHMKYEAYLLVALSILTASSLQAVYRFSFGSKGDLFYWLLATAWLSRHLVVRWLCTRDTSTTRSPTILGVLAHWITSHVMVGQYFDRPEASVVAKSVGNVHGSDESRNSVFATPAVSTLRYTLQLFIVRIWHPIQKRRENSKSQGLLFSRRKSRGHTGEPSSSHFHGSQPPSRRDHGRNTGSSSVIQTISSLWERRWFKSWNIKFLPLQVYLLLVVVSWCIWHLKCYDTRLSMSSHALTMNGRITTVDSSAYDDIAGQDGLSLRSRGASFSMSYARHRPPTWERVLFWLACSSSLATVLAFGRILLPIPDLVAGGSPINAVRAEARLYGSQMGGGGKSSKTRLQKETQDTSWAERYMPITLENRFRLFCAVTLIRILENLAACALVPRTSFVCRATGHCPPGPVLWELSTILYPTGVNAPLRPDGSFQGVFGLISTDHGSAIVSLVSVLVITGLLLFAQEATLDRSYLAIMGYISGEWTIVDHKMSSDRKSGSYNQPAPWDPRRRYKKGDLILQTFPGFGGQSVYKATSNSPEGRPFDLYLRATHDLFRKELGHPGTSVVLSLVVQAHIVWMGFIIAMIGWYRFVGYNSIALIMALVANLVACMGTVKVGLMDYSELQKIGKEISSSVKVQKSL